MSLFDLSGKVALVTGGSRGLGRAFANALAAAGADLAITSRTLDGLKETQAEIAALGRRCLGVAMEVRDVASIQAAVEQVIRELGKIDVLVNNAGMNIRKPTVEVTAEDWDTILDTNLRGAFFVAQAVGQHMLSRGKGRIINVGSMTSVRGISEIAPCSASRGGIKQLTMSLAQEWGPKGVTVNCLAPGWFRTAQNSRNYENAGWVAQLNSRIPLGRSGKAEDDLGGPVVFLASDASRYVTGQTLLVDGGFSMGGISANLLGPHPTAAEIDRFSIEKQVGPLWPPTLIVVTRDDRISLRTIFPALGQVKTLQPTRFSGREITNSHGTECLPSRSRLPAR